MESSGTGGKPGGDSSGADRPGAEPGDAASSGLVLLPGEPMEVSSTLISVAPGAAVDVEELEDHCHCKSLTMTCPCLAVPDDHQLV